MKPGVAVRVTAVLTALFFVVPTAIIVGASVTPSPRVEFPPSGFTLQWYDEVLADPDWTEAFVHSVQVGILAALLAAVVGTLLALAVTRGRVVPPALLTLLATVPMVVPTVIIALSTYLVFVRVGLVGSVLGLALAHAALGVPFVFSNTLTQLGTLNRGTEDAARICGANEVKTFFLVTLPLILPGTITGALLAFVTSWDEVVVAVFMATPDFHTVPIEIFGQLREGVQPSTAAVATIVTSVSLLLLALISTAAQIRIMRTRARLKRSTS
jgi:putative spermidine/putrescine transport system permease protein